MFKNIVTSKNIYSSIAFLLMVLISGFFLALFNRYFPLNLTNNLERHFNRKIILTDGVILNINDKTIRYVVLVNNQEFYIYHTFGSTGWQDMELWIVINENNLTVVPERLYEREGMVEFEKATNFFILQKLQNIPILSIFDIQNFIIAGSTTSDTNLQAVEITRSVVRFHLYGPQIPIYEHILDESFIPIIENDIMIEARYFTSIDGVFAGHSYEVTNLSIYRENSDVKRNAVFRITILFNQTISKIEIITSDNPSLFGNYYEHSISQIPNLQNFIDLIIHNKTTIDDAANLNPSDFTMGATFSRTALIDIFKVLYEHHTSIDIVLDSTFNQITYQNFTIDARYFIYDSDIIVGHMFELINFSQYRDSGQTGNIALRVSFDLDFVLIGFELVVGNDRTLNGFVTQHTARYMPTVTTWLEGSLGQLIDEILKRSPTDIVTGSTWSIIAVQDIIEFLWEFIESERIIYILDHEFNEVIVGNIRINTRFFAYQNGIIIGYKYEVINFSVYRERGDVANIVFSISLLSDKTFIDTLLFEATNTSSNGYFTEHTARFMPPVINWLNEIIGMNLNDVLTINIGELSTGSTFSINAIIDGLILLNSL